MKVTEEVRTTVEARLKESSEYQAQLEKKLMESEKEKQELQEEKRKAVENMEQQVCTELLPQESPGVGFHKASSASLVFHGVAVLWTRSFRVYTGCLSLWEFPDSSILSVTSVE